MKRRRRTASYRLSPVIVNRVVHRCLICDAETECDDMTAAERHAAAHQTRHEVS